MDLHEYEMFSSESHIWTDSNKLEEAMNKRHVVCSSNVRSLRANQQEVEIILDELKPKVFCLQETWNPHLGAANVNGYDLLVKTRMEKRGGGVGLYIDNSIEFKRFGALDNLLLETLEVIGVTLTLGSQETVVVSVYRAPDADNIKTIIDLNNLLDTLKNEKVIIMGDMNIDIAKNYKMKNEYESTIMAHNLIQYVHGFTRITDSSATNIDHAISNISKIEVIISYHTVADHQLIIGIWGNTIKVNDMSKERKSWQNIRKKLDYKKNQNNLEKVNWTEWINLTNNLHVNELYNSFRDIIRSSMTFENQCSRKLRPKKSWMTKEILVFKLEVNKARIKFIKKPSDSNEQAFKLLKTRYRSLLKEAKHRYFASKIKKAGKNSALTWKLIREILNRKPKGEGHSHIIHQNKIIKNNVVTASIFSNYYKNAAMEKIQKLNSEMKFEQYLNKSEKKIDQFSLKEISIKDTWFYIKSVSPKSSSGYDEVPSKLMSRAACLLARPVNTIINRSFSSGEFPHQLKLSKISPIFKKGEPIPSNFRPVSLLSCFSKVIEKAAGDQLQKYMSNHLDNERQFAFKNNHSCLHPILLTRHIIEMELEKGNYVCLVLIDLSLAFDTLECG